MAKHTLAEIEQAMTGHVTHLALDLPAAQAVSSLYRAANAIRAHLTSTVLRKYDLTWTGFTVLWTVWIWEGRETREVADIVGISKATLTGVVRTLEGHGLIERGGVDGDRRLVFLQLTDKGLATMEQLYPEFNAAEADAVAALSPRALKDLTATLRKVIMHVDELG